MTKIIIGLSDKTNYDYEYELFEPIAIHIQIAAEQLVIGMYKPISHQGQAVETQAMMPKRKKPTLKYQMGEEGWGLRTVQGYSLCKILV